MQVGIVAKRDTPRAASLAEAVADAIRDDDVDVRVDETTAAALDAVDDAGSTPTSTPISEMTACDLVVSIGGDGTFLYALRDAGPAPILGVNLGEVGFLNPVAPEDAVETVRREVDRFRQRGDVRTRTLTRVRASGEGWTLPPALNEVAVFGPRRGPAGGVGVEVRVDGSLYAGGRADGVLVATPTGSTAYNLAEGGPLVHPGVDGLVVAEMSAASPMPPLVVGADRTVTVRVEEAPRAVVVGDGRTRRSVDPPTRIDVSTAADPARVAGPPVEFFRALGKLD